MKKVAVIVDEIAEKNSNERLLLFTLEDLYKKGFKVVVYANKFSENFPAYIVKKKTQIAGGFITQKFTSSYLAKDLLKYDAVIAYNYPATLLLAMTKEIYIDSKKNHPVMANYYTSMPASLYGHPSDSAKVIRRAMSKKRMFRKSFEIKRDMLYSDIIDINIASSNSCAKFASSIYEKEFITLYPGVSSSFIEYKKTLEKGSYFLLLNHTHEREKFGKDNIENVILSFFQFLKKNPESDIRLKITGCSMGQMKKEAAFYEVANKIDFINIQSVNDITLLMAGANVVFNTVSEEPFNISIFESWVYGAAPIVDISSASSEIAKDKIDSLVVDSSNPISLTNAMNYFANKNAYAKLAENGKKRLKEEFLISSHTDKLIEILGL